LKDYSQKALPSSSASSFNALKFLKPDVAPVHRIQDEPLSVTQAAGFPQPEPKKSITVFRFRTRASVQEMQKRFLPSFNVLTNAHQGLIYAKGKPAEGAVFSVILPLRQALNFECNLL
jgi:hypothetical protein